MRLVQDTTDRYQFVRFLAAGPLGTVCVAEDRVLNRAVVVKAVEVEGVGDPCLVDRLRRRTQELANLAHPNIAQVYDWVEAEPSPFVVTEYVAGRDLADLLAAEGPLGPARAAAIGADVAAALACTHERGVVHHNLTLDSIVVTDEGVTKVADYAVSGPGGPDVHPPRDGAGPGAAGPGSGRATTDPREDLRSLAMVVYQLAVGFPPLHGPTRLARAYQDVHETPSDLGELDLSVPTGLQAVIDRALSEAPGEGYQSAEELWADLVAAAEGRRPRGGPPRGSGERPGPPATASPGMGEPAGAGRTGGSLWGRPWVYLCLLVVLLLGVGAEAYAVVAPGGSAAAQTRVPRVVGTAFASASASLRAAGFHVREVGGPLVDAPGTVEGQDPPGARRSPGGSTVVVVVSMGPVAAPGPGPGMARPRRRGQVTSAGAVSTRAAHSPDHPSPPAASSPAAAAVGSRRHPGRDHRRDRGRPTGTAPHPPRGRSGGPHRGGHRRGRRP